MKHPRPDVCISDACKNHLKISGTIYLSVEVGREVTIAKFYVVDKLGADVILLCDF